MSCASRIECIGDQKRLIADDGLELNNPSAFRNLLELDFTLCMISHLIELLYNVIRIRSKKCI
jgi:hypothetical protein